LKNLNDSLIQKGLKNHNSFWSETIKKINAIVPESLIDKMREIDNK
jgi:hypothetical protein